MVENDLHPGSAGSSLMVTVGTGAGAGGGGGCSAVGGGGAVGDGMVTRGSVSSENIIGDTVDTCCWNAGAGVASGVGDDMSWSRDAPR